jgi:hypothetical protein
VVARHPQVRYRKEQRRARASRRRIGDVSCACAKKSTPPVLLLQGQAFTDVQASPEPTLCNAFLEVQSKTVEHLVDTASKLKAVLEDVLVSCCYLGPAK